MGSFFWVKMSLNQLDDSFFWRFIVLNCRFVSSRDAVGRLNYLHDRSADLKVSLIGKVRSSIHNLQTGPFPKVNLKGQLLHFGNKMGARHL